MILYQDAQYINFVVILVVSGFYYYTAVPHNKHSYKINHKFVDRKIATLFEVFILSFYLFFLKIKTTILAQSRKMFF